MTAVGLPAGHESNKPSPDHAHRALRLPAPDLVSIVHAQMAPAPLHSRHVGDPQSGAQSLESLSPIGSSGRPAARDAQLLAFIVDHALRPGSAADASAAAQLSISLGLQVRRASLTYT